MPRSKNNIAVLLVHGTFAPNSAWTKDGPLRDALADEFSLSEDDIVKVSWTGANRIGDRESGAKIIKTVVDGLIAKGKKDIWCIGHSHGGSVLLYYLQKYDTGSYVKRVINYNTPYYYMSEKEPNELFDSVLTCLALSLFGYLLLAFVNLIGNFNFYTILFAASISLVSLYFLIGNSKISSVIRSIPDRYRRIVRIINGKFKSKYFFDDKIENTKILSLNTYSDEVRNIFQIYSSIISIPSLLLHRIFLILIFFIYYFSATQGVYVANQQCFQGFNSILLNYFEYTPNCPDTLFFLKYLIIIFIESIVFVVFYILIVNFMYLILFAPFVFLLGFPICSAITELYFIRFEIGVIPSNVISNYELDFPVYGNFLNHSSLYSNEEVIESIVKWLKST